MKQRVPSSKDHISYSIHSIKLNPIVEDTNQSKNLFVYNQMIKESDSPLLKQNQNEEEAKKSESNDMQTLMGLRKQVYLQNSSKCNSSGSMQSFSSHSHKYNMIGNGGYISPILGKHQTDMNSNASDDNEIKHNLMMQYQ